MWHKPQLLNTIADLLFLVAAAAWLAAGSVWLLRWPSLPVRQVQVVTPLQQLKRSEIEQALAGTLAGNFFTVNVDAVRAALEKLPWVRRVQVRRHWPDALELVIEEHRPVARWGSEGRELVNAQGEVFPAWLPESSAAALPLFLGPTGTATEVLRRHGEFTAQLAKLGQRPVRVQLSPRLAWQLQLQDGMRIELGRDNARLPLAARLQRLVDSYAPEWRAAPPAVIDLRYPNGFAVRQRV